MQEASSSCKEYPGATTRAAVHKANPHFHHLGWVAPDDMHMVVQKNNISQPGVKGWGRYMVVDLSHTRGYNTRQVSCPVKMFGIYDCTFTCEQKNDVIRNSGNILNL